MSSDAPVVAAERAIRDAVAVLLADNAALRLRVAELERDLATERELTRAAIERPELFKREVPK